MDRNEQLWTMWRNEFGEFEPRKSYRRFTPVSNSFKNKATCQAECDRRNEKYERYIPLLGFDGGRTGAKKN